MKKTIESRLDTFELVQHRKLLDALLRSVDLIRNMHVCVVSLSEEQDLLSQWRAYASNGGFALGLRSDNLRERAHQQGFSLVPCIYDASEQGQLMSDLIDSYLNRDLSGILAETNTDHADFPAVLSRLAPMFKHASFNEEREWRLVSRAVNVRRLSFRPGVSMLIPYTIFSLGDDPTVYVNKLSVGPSPHPVLAASAGVALLRHAGVADAGRKVLNSTTPFRHW